MASESESETSQKQATDEDKDNDELSSASSESNDLPNISQNQEIVSDLFAYYTEQVRDRIPMAGRSPWMSVINS
jgi:hypothetical protein